MMRVLPTNSPLHSLSFDRVYVILSLTARLSWRRQLPILPWVIPVSCSIFGCILCDFLVCLLLFDPSHCPGETSSGHCVVGVYTSNDSFQSPNDFWIKAPPPPPGGQGCSISAHLFFHLGGN